MKIALCMMAQEPEQLKKQFDDNKEGSHDMYEIRADYFLEKRYEDTEAISEVISYIKEHDVRDRKVILTLRTEDEGGNVSLPLTKYQLQIQSYITDTNADYVDIEAFGENNRDVVEFLVSMAHENGKKAILSNHDLKITPKREEIVLRLLTMEQMGADIPKVAYMATKPEDPQTLLMAAEEAKSILKTPFIALSMGELGKATRICGGDFGSAVTFGFADSLAAAPGQVKVAELTKLMDEYYA